MDTVGTEVMVGTEGMAAAMVDMEEATGAMDMVDTEVMDMVDTEAMETVDTEVMAMEDTRRTVDTS